MADVLIIDDDKGMNRMLADLITDIGHSAQSTHTLSQGMAAADSGDFDVVFLDVMLPDGNGLDIIKDLRALPACPEVVIMTGVGDPDGAEMAIRSGAWDYLQKPLSPKKILLPLKRVLQYRDSVKARNPSATPLERHGIVGSGPAITTCLDRLQLASRTNASVLVTGETGTGKELFVRCLHKNSAANQGRFVVVDCAALPGTLIETALFGHKKGAFTGADTEQEGLVELANNGTLFLDEVGELDLKIQKTFLRVLQEKRFRPVGGKEEQVSRFRLAAATNRDLDRMVAQGGFRKDLLYRLKTLVLELPPLRERMEDLPELVSHFMGLSCEKFNVPDKNIARECLDLLSAYDWPGNVRELAGTIESAVSAGLDAPTLFLKHLPDQIRIQVVRSRVGPAKPASDASQPETTPMVPAWTTDAP
ncbi:MAG: sigma-54 dependent transcriptional regulator, partial [Desulfobacterales bacterium]|nr:sigma-54 dependent transcriptional regulator [Desulfobacterales bacterium]